MAAVTISLKCLSLFNEVTKFREPIAGDIVALGLLPDMAFLRRSAAIWGGVVTTQNRACDSARTASITGHSCPVIN